MPGWVKDAGFADMEEHVEIVPIGTWTKDKKLKEIGKYYLVHFLIGKMAMSGSLRRSTHLSQVLNTIPWPSSLDMEDGDLKRFKYSLRRSAARS